MEESERERELVRMLGKGAIDKKGTMNEDDNI